MVRHDVVDMGHNQANTATGLGEPVMQHPFRGKSVSRHEQSGMAGDDDSVSHGHRADGERGKQMLKLRCRHVFVTRFLKLPDGTLCPRGRYNLAWHRLYDRLLALSIELREMGLY